jgi:hypothetical protein
MAVRGAVGGEVDPPRPIPTPSPVELLHGKWLLFKLSYGLAFGFWPWLPVRGGPGARDIGPVGVFPASGEKDEEGL